MPLQANLLAKMIDTVQIAPRTSVDADRVESFGAAEDVKARVEASPVMIQDSRGRQSVASATIYIPAEPVVLETAKITLPDGRSPQILRVDRLSDRTGPHHQVIYV